MLLIGRSVYAKTVLANKDRVIGSIQLPKGGKLKSVSGEIHVNGPESQAVNLFNAYGVSGSMVPVPDMETAIENDELWDDVIVKASDPTQAAGTVGFDFDWTTDNDEPEIEPGDMDVDALLGATQEAKEFLAPRLEWVSWAKSRQGGYAAATPDTWLPSDYKTFRSKRTLVADEPSVCLIGFSSPALDERATADATFGSGSKWWMLQNMDATLLDMSKAQAGLLEAGAESPYADATAAIVEMIAPTMKDESVTLFKSLTWTVLCVCTWVVELPETSIPKVLDGR